MERGGYTVATTYASSYNINFRGCSKFVSGAVFLSRKCAKACNRRNFSLLQKFFFWTAQCQFAHIAVLKCGPAPGHMFEPTWPHIEPRKTFRGPESFSNALSPVTCSNPPGPTKTQRTPNLDGTRRGNKFRI